MLSPILAEVRDALRGLRRPATLRAYGLALLLYAAAVIVANLGR